MRTYTLTPGDATPSAAGTGWARLGTASQGVWSTARLDFSAPPGGVAKLHFGAFGGSIPGLVQQSAGTLDLYSMQIRVGLRGRVCLSNGPAGSATLDGLTAQGNVGCDQLLCNDVNCTWTPRAQSPAQRSQPQAPSPEPRYRPQGLCRASRGRPAWAC